MLTATYCELFIILLKAQCHKIFDPFGKKKSQPEPLPVVVDYTPGHNNDYADTTMATRTRQ